MKKTGATTLLLLAVTGLLRADDLVVRLVEKNDQPVFERTEWTVTGIDGTPYHQLTAGSHHRFSLPQGRFVVTATTRSGLTGTRQFVVRADTGGILKVK